jgi:2-octaprenyl-6-methoxyphenol hydroxylase
MREHVTAERTTDVLISGGGFVGLVLALALSKTLGGELAVTVVDPGPLDPARVKPDARARALGTASIRLLTAIGVWPQIEHLAERVSAIEITDSALGDGIRPALLTYDPSADGEGMVIVENAPLLAALLGTARATPGLTLLAGRRVSALAAEQMRPARVTLDDGTVIAAALAVAADGRASPLRAMAGIKSMGWSYPQAGIVTSIAHELPHGGKAVQHFLPGGPFALLPLRSDQRECNRSCVTWSEDTSEAHRLMSVDDATFRDALEERAGGKLGRISLDGPRQSWPLELHLARALAANRVALIGDAVRSVHPLAGQGLNLGLRDCAALAEVIEDAARAGQDIGVATTLERYERWRRADGAMSAAAFDGLNRLFSNDWIVLRTARTAGLGLVDRMPGLKRLLVGEAAGLTGDLPRLMR